MRRAPVRTSRAKKKTARRIAPRPILARKVDQGDPRPRKPRADWSVGRAEKWIAQVLRVPPQAVRLMLPRGNRRAQLDATIGDLRREWQLMVKT